MGACLSPISWRAFSCLSFRMTHVMLLYRLCVDVVALSIEEGCVDWESAAGCERRATSKETGVCIPEWLLVPIGREPDPRGTARCVWCISCVKRGGGCHPNEALRLSLFRRSSVRLIRSSTRSCWLTKLELVAMTASGATGSGEESIKMTSRGSMFDTVKHDAANNCLDRVRA